MTTQTTTNHKADSSAQAASRLRGFIYRFLATERRLAPLVLRIFLGGVMLPHGMQKLLGSFGGYGFTGSMGFFTEQLGMPWLVGFLVIMLEFFGSLLLIVGFGTRFVAASFAAVMLGAIVMVAGTNGFFMNWFGQQAGEGYEYHLLMVGMAVSLVLSGGGCLSADRKLSGPVG